MHVNTSWSMGQTCEELVGAGRSSPVDTVTMGVTAPGSPRCKASPSNPPGMLEIHISLLFPLIFILVDFILFSFYFDLLFTLLDFGRLAIFWILTRTDCPSSWPRCLQHPLKMPPRWSCLPPAPWSFTVVTGWEGGIPERRGDGQDFMVCICLIDLGVGALR